MPAFAGMTPLYRDLVAESVYVIVQPAVATSRSVI
jgi:hypothetical protein